MGQLKDSFRKVFGFKHLLRGLRGRWMVNSLALIFLLVIVAVTAYSIAAASYYTSNLRAAVESRARATAGFFSRYINTGYNEYFRTAYRFAEEYADRDKLELQFVNMHGRVEVSTMGLTVGMEPGTPDVQRAFQEGQVDSFIGIDPLSNERVLSVSAPLMFSNNQVVGVMRYVSSMRLADRQVIMSAGVAMLFGLAVIAFVAVSNLFFIRTILTPIQEINEIAKKIAGGSYGAIIDKKYNDEIGELTDTINNMSAEISMAERIKNDFISSVSHELRTPLTSISGWGETLLQSNLKDQEEVKKGVRIMLKEAHRLTKMVEELLEFTRMEGGRMVLQMEPTDVRAEFEEVVFLYMDALAREGITLTYEESEEIPSIMADRGRLRQVFINIIDNAAKHGADGKLLETSIGVESGHVVVRVRDHGPGIPHDELPHVKMKFYKGSSKARGSGIGLAISDEIVRLHDGELTVESTLGEGTTVSVRIPVQMGSYS